MRGVSRQGQRSRASALAQVPALRGRRQGAATALYEMSGYWMDVRVERAMTFAATAFKSL